MSARSGILACTLFLLLTGVAAAAVTPPRGPEELWQEFPLDPAVTSSDTPEATTPAATRPQAERPAAVTGTMPVAEKTPPPAEQTPPATQRTQSVETLAGDGDSGATIWLTLALGAIGGSVLGVFSARSLLARRSRRRQSAPDPQPVEMPQEAVVDVNGHQRNAEERTTVLRKRRGKVVPMSNDKDQALPVAEASVDTSEPSSYGEIGERVAAVLSAAEAAAEQIRTDARRQAETEAEEIRADARRQAEEALEQARQEADGIRAEAAAYETDTHAAVDSFAAERRREAEQQARQQLAHADAQARATREAAEEMAVQIEEGGRQRQLALQEESRSVEEALQRALQELRRMTLQLEALVGTPASRPGRKSRWSTRSCPTRQSARTMPRR